MLKYRQGCIWVNLIKIDFKYFQNDYLNRRFLIDFYYSADFYYQRWEVEKKYPGWMKKYNSHKDLKASRTGGTVIMTKGGKTTFEERVEMASYSILHNHNDSETPKKCSVSY